MVFYIIVLYFNFGLVQISDVLLKDSMLCLFHLLFHLLLQTYHIGRIFLDVSTRIN